MNTRQKIHDATLSKWLDILRDQRSSGMTVKDWCADNGISIHAFYYWKRIAKASYVDSVLPDIVPLPAPSLPEVTCATCTTCATTSDGSHNPDDLKNSSDPITVSIGDISISIGGSPTDDLITRIIGAVRHA